MSDKLAPVALESVEEPKADALGELVVQHATGLPVIWKPLDKDGRSPFDAHPEGEGYGPKDYQRDVDSGLYSKEQLAAWLPGVFDRVRMTKAQADECFAEVDMPAPDPLEQVKAILGNTSVKLEEALAEIADDGVRDRARMPVRCYTVAALDAAPASYALDADSNVVRKEWSLGVAPPAVAVEDVLAKREAIDTKQNAILTVGTGKTYSTISAGIAASSEGDCIECYSTTSNTYTEAVSITTNVTLRGMVGTRGITITYNSGSTVNVTTVSTGICISNFKIVTTSNSGIAANCGGALLYTRPVYRCCHMYNGSGSAGTTIGLNSLSTGVGVPIAENCLIEGFAVGAYGSATRHVCTIHCTIVKCTTGMDAYTATNAHAIATIAAGCTTAFNNLRTTTTLFAVSDDKTASGISPATGFVTTDFEDYAGGDYRIKASVAATTKARFLGYPWIRGDGFEAVRCRCGTFTAGYHEPVPGLVPDAEDVLAPASGGPAAYGNDNELVGTAEAGHESHFIAPLVNGGYDSLSVWSNDGATLLGGSVLLGTQVWIDTLFGNAERDVAHVWVKLVVRPGPGGAEYILADFQAALTSGASPGWLSDLLDSMTEDYLPAEEGRASTVLWTPGSVRSDWKIELTIEDEDTSDAMSPVSIEFAVTDKLYSAAEEAARNTVPTLSLIPSEGNGGPAPWLQLGVSREGTGSGGGGGCSCDTPICVGAIDAAPYAQGLIKVRFYEMICLGGSLPYRYDFHVKPMLDGPLTKAEIDAGTYFATSVYQDQINPDLYDGSPFGDPGIASAAIAIESAGDSGDNLHPFTNQEYQIAVRAVAIDGIAIAEDDNDEVVVSYSNGYQGTTSIEITKWPCVELCTPLDLSDVRITQMPALQAAITSLVDLVVKQMPPMEVVTRQRRKARGKG